MGCFCPKGKDDIVGCRVVLTPIIDPLVVIPPYTPAKGEHGPCLARLNFSLCFNTLLKAQFGKKLQPMLT